MSRRPGRALTFVIALLTLAVVIGGFVVALIVLRPGPVVIASCTAGTYEMDPEQAQNAAIITSVAEQRQLPHHAVVVAIAVAMQESRLRNLNHGDRDSLGLFQQRPSQGWGTAAQVQDPLYAAGAFFTHLVKVKNWQTVAVTVAGQAVQRSGRPNAYAQWAPRATAIAAALTGDTPAGMTCHYATSDIALPTTGLSPTFRTDAVRDLGNPVLGADLTAERGWLVVGWLISHAAAYQITEVSYAGQLWRATKGDWTVAPATSNQVVVVRQKG
ncbi:hypothetical protein acdb102_32390 [Acidothermaceae bacterium B102]|nr:hypothetical protein acdb102_32390 [Acidothermaceae bacterium B102]